MNTGDQIRLQLPANPEYGRLGRIAAAQFARRQGLSLQEIDDLRLAMDEVVTLLVGPASRPGSVVLDFTAVDHGLVVEARLDRDTDAGGSTDRSADPPGDGPSVLPGGRIQRFEAHVVPLVADVAVDAATATVTFTKAHRAGR